MKQKNPLGTAPDARIVKRTIAERLWVASVNFKLCEEHLKA